MPKYNRQFDLNQDELSLIETALRERSARLVDAKAVAEHGNVSQAHIEDTIRAGEELLGRLHNQKVFYRPKKRVYIGG